MRARTSAKGLAGASLAFRVLAALVGVVSLTMLLAQGWSVQSNYRDRSRLLNEHAAQIALIAAEGIARPLFDFNTPVVATSVAALARGPGFVGAAARLGGCVGAVRSSPPRDRQFCPLRG